MAVMEVIELGISGSVSAVSCLLVLCSYDHDFNRICACTFKCSKYLVLSFLFLSIV